MRPYTVLCSSLLFPIHERLKGHQSVALRKQLDDSQWLSAVALEDRQRANLQVFMQRIARDVPYYRRLFADRGLSAEDIRSAADLTKLPTLDKPTIRAHAEELKNPSAVRLRSFNTGGSSGQPLLFYVGERVDHDVAAKWRVTRWWNVDIGDRELVLWGSPIEVSTQDRVKSLRDRFLRTKLVPAFDLGEPGIRQFIDAYRQFDPHMLFGYPSAIARIARYADDRRVGLPKRALQVVFATAERLYPEQRVLIQRVFEAPVANGYGARDAGFLAHECPSGGMHIMAEDVIIETLGSDGLPTAPGIAGEVTVTHLRTGDFPFVRYKTGDVAVLAEQRCTCGRGLPLLASIEGRSTDFVVAQDGTVMHGLALIYVVREIEGVESFRIIQHSLTDLEVLLVANGWQEHKARKLEAGMQARLGKGVNVRINRMDHIATEANGKFRYIISKVAT